ncbi:natural resistance-associated macrophage protein [Cryphonectria parasitica EP155]|uniref:Natural resistance-associated macrophage protein n=1 Tax=Cryphonectria parasitica (strain ATCC 38755 / EP155) TaxID=660469 RepID=A0A9P5CJS2_CRYP1|nr:natural resistance-associated macrophage protein [Cryphonectria parasitica EP155]KAF3761298.1 natural resistance-associated macrophage protein [Cryphonectria parasitica EP155]
MGNRLPAQAAGAVPDRVENEVKKATSPEHQQQQQQQQQQQHSDHRQHHHTPRPFSGASHRSPLHRAGHAITTFGRFVGPGFMVAVAYIDPGNYATGISAGATYRFRLLFIILLSNLFAILLQSLCIKLGTVTGLNLAEACRAHLPPWLNFVLYILAEVAIIATDIAEVIGTAIAINLLLPQVPLVAGCAISILDVMLILLFYSPNGSMRGLRAFEAFVVALVLAVVVCFCIQMSFIQNATAAEVFRGYLPSAAIVEQQGLYQACGILGATVMPHSLYLGSGMPQSRLKEFDTKQGSLLLDAVAADGRLTTAKKKKKTPYIPSLAAIRHCWKYSVTELAVSLFSFALFINSAILIIAGSSLYGSEEAQGDDIFAIHGLLTRTLGKGAGILFALALLLSGVSAGIVCTIAGQMVSEGALDWHMRPWLRRLMTRSISITPSIIIAGAVGRDGLDAALNGSQVVLSVVLPFVSAPLIYFTCMSKYMKVSSGRARGARQAAAAVVGEGGGGEEEEEDNDDEDYQLPALTTTVSAGENVKMANSIPVVIIAVLVWLIIAAMNVANLVLLGLGKE